MPESTATKKNEQEELLTVKEAADFLKVKNGWVYRQIRLKTIPVLRFGKYRRFKKSELIAFGEGKS